MTSASPEHAKSSHARKHRGTKENPWHETVRKKIQASQILNRLIQCAEGDLPLTPTQATVGLGLVKKVLPDLQENENKNSGTITVKIVC